LDGIAPKNAVSDRRKKKKVGPSNHRSDKKIKKDGMVHPIQVRLEKERKVG
jgi:hypothetical protein